MLRQVAELAGPRPCQEYRDLGASDRAGDVDNLAALGRERKQAAWLLAAQVGRDQVRRHAITDS